MLPVRLAAENVRKMHLYNGQLSRLQGVEQRDRGVRIGAGIENDALRLVACLLHPRDKLALAVGLAEVDAQRYGLGARFGLAAHVIERIRPVYGGLAQSQHVQVGSVEDVYRLGHEILAAGMSRSQ